MDRLRPALIWAALALALAVPLVAAAMSPLLAWRSAIYVIGGFAGIVAIGLVLVQPLLAAGLLPGLGGYAGRRVHRAVGVALVLFVVAHVAGLWITSPPDMIDALLFRSPTPFSAWGVVAFWAIVASAGIALWRRRLGLRWARWRHLHRGLAGVIAVGSVVHAMLIEGAMEPVTKAVLCGLILLALGRALWRGRRPGEGGLR